MPFHVELRHSFRRAWAFNLDAEKLRRTVVEPWYHGRPVELGDREWDPGASTLRILEGPELGAPDLAMGQGWHNAERSARDVTAQVLDRAATAAATVAVLAETPSGQLLVSELLQQLGVRTVDWTVLRARILAAATVVAGPRLEGSEVVAAILVIESGSPTRAWLFEAGLALGALGGRAIVAQIGDKPTPGEVRDLGVIRLNPEQPASLHALAERLRHASRPSRSG
jgi:hypothetical protein